jgi:hypothetical protein
VEFLAWQFSFAALGSTELLNLLLFFHMLVTHNLFSTVYLYSMFEGSASSSVCSLKAIPRHPPRPDPAFSTLLYFILVCYYRTACDLNRLIKQTSLTYRRSWKNS